VEDERPSTVDLDDGKELAVPALEVGIATDVDFFELEVIVGANRRKRRPRSLAQVTTFSAVENDVLAAKPPVRVSGPGEGVRGNREVPPFAH
jgi:hypothetical protein